MDEKMMKLEQLLNDPAEVEQVFVSDYKQTLANLAARGIEMTQEELVELLYGILDGSTPSENGELTEDALENVAGGGLSLRVAPKTRLWFLHFITTTPFPMTPAIRPGMRRVLERKG